MLSPYDTNTGTVSLVPMLAEVTVTANRYEDGEGIYGWDNLMRESIGGGMVYAGRNTKPVSGKTGGATPGTSKVSEYLAKKYPRNIPQKNPKLWKLLKKLFLSQLLGNHFVLL